MAVTKENVRLKLQELSDSQNSIETLGQWFIFNQCAHTALGILADSTR